MDWKITGYVEINRGVQQGTVLGLLLFSLIVNDIKLVDLKHGIAGYADEIAINVLLKGTVQS